MAVITKICWFLGRLSPRQSLWSRLPYEWDFAALCVCLPSNLASPIHKKKKKKRCIAHPPPVVPGLMPKNGKEQHAASFLFTLWAHQGSLQFLFRVPRDQTWAIFKSRIPPVSSPGRLEATGVTSSLLLVLFSFSSTNLTVEHSSSCEKIRLSF